MSLNVSEKKATSAPETTNESMVKPINKNTSTVVACGSIMPCNCKSENCAEINFQIVWFSLKHFYHKLTGERYKIMH